VVDVGTAPAPAQLGAPSRPLQGRPPPRPWLPFVGGPDSSRSPTAPPYGCPKPRSTSWSRCSTPLLTARMPPSSEPHARSPPNGPRHSSTCHGRPSSSSSTRARCRPAWSDRTAGSPTVDRSTRAWSVARGRL